MSKIEGFHAAAEHEEMGSHHGHTLSPFRKIICWAELAFSGWLVYFCCKIVYDHTLYIISVLK